MMPPSPCYTLTLETRMGAQAFDRHWHVRFDRVIQIELAARMVWVKDAMHVKRIDYASSSYGLRAASLEYVT